MMSDNDQSTGALKEGLAQHLKHVVRRVSVRLEPLEDAEADEARDDAECELLSRLVHEEDGDSHERQLSRTCHARIIRASQHGSQL